MTLLQSIVYGLISGVTDFFPVSQQAHQALVLQIFGLSQRQPLKDLFVHIAIVLALLLACASSISRLRRDLRLSSRTAGKRSRVYDMRGQYELRLLRSAVLPMLAGILIYFATDKLEGSMAWISLLLLINGVFILIPEHMRHGNKDARSMSGMDGMLIGLAAAFSAVPGISRNSAIMFMTLIREADKQNGVTWALMLAVPAMVMLILLDFISMFTVGIGTITLVTVGGYLLSMLFAFFGAYLGVLLIRRLISRADYSAFAYYDFGLALLSFVLYLIA